VTVRGVGLHSPIRFGVALLFLAAAPMAALAAEPPEPGGPRLEGRTSSVSGARNTDLSAAERALAPPTGPEVLDDPAWRFYHLAFQALANGNDRECRELLEHITKSFAQHPAADRSRQLLVQLGTERKNKPADPALLAATPPPPGDASGETATTLARAELVIGQTAHGIGLGLEICLLAKCDDVRAFGATMILGGASGLTASLFLSGNGITPGHASALNSGVVWGLAEALFITGIVNPRDSQSIVVGPIIGQLVGLGAGELLWQTTHATAGDVSLASSGGLWSALLAMNVALAVSDKEEVIFGTMLAASSVGLVAGALTANAFPMSRGRVLVIDGSAALGGLLGLGLAFTVQGQELERGPLFLLIDVGILSGLALSTFFTRDWDAPELPPITMGIMPLPNGGAQFSLAMPL